MRSLPISLLAAALLIGGCASLPDQWVRFPGLSDCPETSPPSLLANGDRFGPGSSTHSLQCALSVARNSNAPEVQRSALPSRLALHLAERLEGIVAHNVGVIECDFDPSGPNRWGEPSIVTLLSCTPDQRLGTLRKLSDAKLMAGT